MSGSSPDFLDDVPEVYSMASTGEIGMAPKDGAGEMGDVHNRLRGGADLSREGVRGNYLELYKMAPAKELDTGPREEKQEAGHVYNRLRDASGTSEGVMEKDLETYNVAAGKLEPDYENQTEKDVPNNLLQPGNPYSVVSTIASDPLSSSLDVEDGGGAWTIKVKAELQVVRLALVSK